MIKNVIIVCDSSKMRGGASSVARRDASLLVQNGINVIYFTADGYDGMKNEIRFISSEQKEFISYENVIHGALAGLYNFHSGSMMSSLLDDFNPNETVVHFHSWLKSLSSSVILQCKLHDFSCAFTVHDYFLKCPNGGFYDYNKSSICTKKPYSLACIITNCDKRRYTHKLYRLIRGAAQECAFRLNGRRNALIYVSNFSKAIYDNYGKKNASEYILCNRIADKNTRTYSYIENNHEIYLYIGRLDQEKGIVLFCEAIKNLGLKGVVIGSGAKEEWLSNKYSDYKDLSFVGWQNRDSWNIWLKKAKALVIPSLLYETSVLVGYEVESECNVPVIVADRCAATEYLNCDDGHLYFESGNLKSLQSVILKLEDKLKNDKKFEPIANIGLQTEDEYCEKLIDIYNDILHKR